MTDSPAFVFNSKLKRLKIALKEWNRSVFGNVNMRLNQAELQLDIGKVISDPDRTSVSKFASLADAKTAVELSCVQLAIMLRQKARAT